MRSRQVARTTTGTTDHAAIRHRCSSGIGLSALAGGPSRSAQSSRSRGPWPELPAVRHERLYRAGRFEIAPTVSFTLLDEYRRRSSSVRALQYNITDWLGFGVWGAYGALQLDTNLTTEIDQTAPRNIETAVNLNHTNANGTGSAPFTNQVAKWNWDRRSADSS